MAEKPTYEELERRVQELEKAEHDFSEERDRAEHLRNILLVIRNANQLIVRETDPKTLVKKVCSELTKTRGYLNAWIALMDEAETCASVTASSGFNGGFNSMKTNLHEGIFPSCMKKAFAENQLVVTKNPLVDCPDCPLSIEYANRAGMSCRLFYSEKTYGVLSVSVPGPYAYNKEEHALFNELADDLAFALNKIETDAQVHRLNQIVTSVPQPISLISQDYRYLAVNDVYADLFETAAQKIIGQTPADFFGKQVFETEIKPRLDHVLKGNVLQYEIQADFPGRGKRWMYMSYYPYRNETGDITSVISHGHDITDRKQTEDELRRNEKDLRESQRIAHVGSWRLNVATNQVFWTEELYNMYGFDPSLPPPPYTEHMKLFTPESWERLSTALARTRDTGIPYTLELETVRKDGSNGWMWVRGEAEVDSAGKTVQLWGAAQDITERKQVEENLRQTKAILQTAMDCSPEGIAIADAPDGRLRYVNDAGLLIRGGDRQKVVKGVGVEQYVASWKLLDLDGRPLRTDEVPLARAIMFGETNSRDFIIRRKKGEDRIVTANAAPVKDETGKITAGIVVFLDITERKRAEDALRENENVLNITGQMAKIGGWELYPETMEVTWTDETYRIHEVPKNIKPPLDDAINFWHPEDQPVLRKAIQQALDNGIPYDLELRFITAKGRSLYARTKCNPVLHNGKVIKLQGFFQDITERKQAEAEKEKLQSQLHQSQKMESIGSLAGGIAHDFNNLLFPIVGLSEMMLNDFSPDSPEHQNLHEIFLAGKRGRELVQQILSFSRQSEQELIPVHIQKVLKEVFSLCRATIPTDISTSLDIQSECGPIMADPTQIHQIAMNLITNAYHSLEPAGGTISIQLTETDVDQADDSVGDLGPGRYAMLSVSDTGTGIDPTVIDKIFDPYFTTKEKGRGTGLGLATVYGIVKAYGGEIRVYSDIGKGSSFHIYLPVLEKSKNIDTGKQQKPLPTGTEHILLVDDEQPIVNLEKQMLERLGYQISSFTSSVDAVAAFRADPTRFDLVITDMSMPNLTGIQLAGELITIRPNIPIILCTGFSQRIKSKKAEALGLRAILMKPVGMKDLAQRIREVLDEMKE
jgi:PAS domain S-box-containing protein